MRGEVGDVAGVDEADPALAGPPRICPAATVARSSWYPVSDRMRNGSAKRSVMKACTAGQAIVATVRRAIPDAKLWRFEARPPGPPRYEEQDLPLLLQDLRRNST